MIRIARGVLPLVLLLSVSVPTLSGCSGGSFNNSSDNSALRRYEGSYTLTLSGTAQSSSSRATTVEGTFTGFFVSSDARGSIDGTLSLAGYNDCSATGVFLPNGSFTITATPQQGHTTTLSGQAIANQGAVTVTGTFSTVQGGTTLASGTFTGGRTTR